MRQHSPLVPAHVLVDTAESNNVGVALRILGSIDLVERLALENSVVNVLLDVKTSQGEISGRAAGEQLGCILTHVLSDGAGATGMDARVVIDVVDCAEDDGPVFGSIFGLDLILYHYYSSGQLMRD